MVARKKTETEEPKTRKKDNSFFSDLFILLFVGVSCFYLGVYREPVGSFIHRTTPVVVKAAMTVGEKIKEGYCYVSPRIGSVFENVMQKINKPKVEEKSTVQNSKQIKVNEPSQSKK